MKNKTKVNSKLLNMFANTYSLSANMTTTYNNKRNKQIKLTRLIGIW